ncbi:hypothetical protein [Bacillus sp. ISL-7]|uniref:hypothetical protein n=1 Tax=Bacillus sp. ISL-7 TaxID=2819136 RepID=UPI001BE6E694|nr:hypothetical protein [Bacillus sp. ISL-7]MBT2736213.1 hypothetical protein [Bacillus sp. ISL-7]
MQAKVEKCQSALEDAYKVYFDMFVPCISSSRGLTGTFQPEDYEQINDFFNLVEYSEENVSLSKYEKIDEPNQGIEQPSGSDGNLESEIAKFLSGSGSEENLESIVAKYLKRTGSLLEESRQTLNKSANKIQETLVTHNEEIIPLFQNVEKNITYIVKRPIEEYLEKVVLKSRFSLDNSDRMVAYSKEFLEYVRKKCSIPLIDSILKAIKNVESSRAKETTNTRDVYIYLDTYPLNVKLWIELTKCMIHVVSN